MRDLLLKLCRRENLTRAESRQAFENLAAGRDNDVQISALLMGLSVKGVNLDELVGAAEALREKLVPLPCDHSQIMLDTCGTGGDVKGTFNISTTAALIIAACGVTVAKHGNRSASSVSGSADVLEKLGVKIEITPEKAGICLREIGICFAFARAHHPALRGLAQVRSTLGIPTIFNMLAPLLNPAHPRHQIIGVYAPEFSEKMALALHELGSQRAWVVHAEDGLDELSTMSPSRVSELRDGKVTTWKLEPRELGLPRARLEDLTITSIDEAATVLRSVLAGEKGPRREICLLNAAAGLVVAEKARDLSEGLKLAADAIDSGRATQTLNRLIAASQAD